MHIQAIGFLRQDVSGLHQPYDESQIISLAKRLGYHLRIMIICTDGANDIGLQLRNIAEVFRADAVVVPSTAHFDGEAVPSKLIRVVDVITVEPEYTYSRQATRLPAPEPCSTIFSRESRSAGPGTPP